jgi:hypothetical protein
MVIESKPAKSKWTLSIWPQGAAAFWVILTLAQALDEKSRKRLAARFRPLSIRGKGRYTRLGLVAVACGTACSLRPI